MAFTILDRHDNYSSVYAPCKWLTNDTLKTKEGFEYIADIYSGNTALTLTYLTRLKFPKRPSTGYGLIDLQSVLRPYVDHEADLVPGSTGFTPAPHYAIEFACVFGQSFHFFEIDDNYYAGGNVGFTSSTDNHDFIVRDEILVQQDVPFTNAAYEGIHTITSIPDSHSFVIDLAWGGVTPPEPGRARKADVSSIVFSGVATGTSIVCGYALPRDEWTDFDPSTIVTSSGNTEPTLLTNCPDTYRMRTDDPAWLPVTNNEGGDTLRVITYDSSGVQLGVYGFISTLMSNGIPFSYVGIGPWNLSNTNLIVVSGPTDIINADVAYYLVGVLSSPAWGESTTGDLRIDIDRRCQHYTNFKLLFCDKMGAWMPINAYFRNTETHTVAKQTYEKAFGEVQGSSIVHSDAMRGVDPYHTEHLKSWVTRTDWMSQAESDYMMDLFASPRVFWVQSSTKYVPLIINDGEVERLQLDNLDEEQIRYEVSFSKAAKEPTIN